MELAPNLEPKRSLAAVLVLLTAVLPAGATWTNDSWTALALKPGTKLVVMNVDGRVHKGRLLEWTSEAVAVKTEAEPVNIPRGNVAVVRAAGPLGDFHTVWAPWENLGHLSVGQRIRVIRTNWSQVDGTLAGSTEEGITVARRGKAVFVTRNRIRKVRILVKSSAEKGFTVGATAGFLAALVILVAAATQGGSPQGAEQILEVSSLGGGKAGEALSNLFDQYQTIYLSPQK